jgi:hypothetical protein
MDCHKISIYGRFDFSGLDETIEFLTPPSPGRVKNGEDGALTRRHLRLDLVEKGIGGRRALRVR